MAAPPDALIQPRHPSGVLTTWLHSVNVPVGEVFGLGAGEVSHRFPLDQGGSVVVEVNEVPAEPMTRGLGKDRFTLVEEADTTFEDATATVTPAARRLIARLLSIDDPPDEVGIEFRVQLGAQAGALIASVAAEANFKVSMTWRAPGDESVGG
jgi:hypothetical protein